MDGFYEHLSYFSKNREKLTKALAHSFELSQFFIAVKDDIVMAMAACNETKLPSIRLEKRQLSAHLGFIRGRLAYVALNKYMLNQPHPFQMRARTGSIEFVACAADYRGQGITHNLLSTIIDVTNCEDYVLEVMDSNKPAINLYKKLGFEEVNRKPAPKFSGFEFFVYMRHTKVNNKEQNGKDSKMPAKGEEKR